jgi:hypothetical protein
MQQAALLLAATVLAGCGGGDEAMYSVRPTVTCLVQLGAPVTQDEAELYDVAEGAGEGGFMVRFERNGVAVGVERTAEDAKRSENAYRMSAEFFESDPGDLLERHGNVVILWEKTPTEDERRIVEDCLRE